jgi:hypothetical protein
MGKFFEQHQVVIGAIAAGTSITGSVMTWLQILTPIFAFVSAFFGAVVGLLTLIHFLRRWHW